MTLSKLLTYGIQKNQRRETPAIMSLEGGDLSKEAT
jgi:hypothetical protein